MRTSEKEILRGVLGRMGDEAAEPVPFEELHTVLVQPVDKQRNTWWTRRPIWIAVAAAVTVLVLVGGAMLLTNTETESIYLADSEVLLSTDPPVVQGAESPEPAFDTSGLGEEVPLTPVTETSRILETVTNDPPHDPNGEVIRITVLGETPEGVLALIVHAEGKGLRGDPMQMRCQTTTLGGTLTCGGYTVEEAANMPGGLLPPEPGTGPSYSVGERSSDTALTWEVPAETSLVTLTINDQTRWQRPVADVAVFITDLIYGDRFELTAYDSQGNILDSFSTVASLDDPHG